MGQVQVDHRGIDLFVSKELLDRVEMCAGLQQMRGKGMAQRMDGGPAGKLSCLRATMMRRCKEL